MHKLIDELPHAILGLFIGIPMGVVLAALLLGWAMRGATL